MTFLDEQLEKVYLFENAEKAIPIIKAKSPAIGKAMKSGNLVQVRRLLNTLPDASLEEVFQSAHAKIKNFHRYHLEAKRLSKGDSSEAQKVFVLTYGCVKALKESAKDKSVIQSIDNALLKLRAFATRYSNVMMNEGFTLGLLMLLIAWFFQWVPILLTVAVGLAYAGGMVFMVGVLLMMVRMVLNTYFSLKGIK